MWPDSSKTYLLLTSTLFYAAAKQTQRQRTSMARRRSRSQSSTSRMALWTCSKRALRMPRRLTSSTAAAAACWWEGSRVADLCKCALAEWLTMDSVRHGACSAVCQQVVIVQRQPARLSTYTSTL